MGDVKTQIFVSVKVTEESATSMTPFFPLVQVPITTVEVTKHSQGSRSVFYSGWVNRTHMPASNTYASREVGQIA